MHNLVSSAKPATLQAPRISLKQRTHGPGARKGFATDCAAHAVLNETVGRHVGLRGHTGNHSVITISSAQSPRNIQFAVFLAHELFGYRDANCALASSALF